MHTCEKHGDNAENQLQCKFDGDDQYLVQLDHDELNRWPELREVVDEVRMLGTISGPVVVMGLLLYLRGLISMQLLGYLGELEVAGGSLSIGFANITGYSVIYGLAIGMEPLCSQALGAKRWSLLGISLQRSILILLCSTVPISLLWLNMESILLWCGQDESITRMAGTYILYSLPDLIAQSFLHPLRNFLRTQPACAYPAAIVFGINLCLLFF